MPIGSPIPLDPSTEKIEVDEVTTRIEKLKQYMSVEDGNWWDDTITELECNTVCITSIYNE